MFKILKPQWHKRRLGFLIKIRRRHTERCPFLGEWLALRSLCLVCWVVQRGVSFHTYTIWWLCICLWFGKHTQCSAKICSESKPGQANIRGYILLMAFLCSQHFSWLTARVSNTGCFQIFSRLCAKITFLYVRVCVMEQVTICMWFPPEGELQLLCMLNVRDLWVSMFVYVLISVRAFAL